MNQNSVKKKKNKNFQWRKKKVRIKTYDEESTAPGSGTAMVQEKVSDGTCVIVKVDSKENNSDIGTKRVSKIIFEYLTHNLIDKSLRTNI